MSIENMLDEIAGQAKLFQLCTKDLMDQAKAIVRKDGFKEKLNKVYITGCGDSYFAGIATRDTFIRYAGVHTEVYQALEFSRYICNNGEVDDRAMVISVSSSGKVSRSVEALLRAKECGALSVAVTANSDGPLAKAAVETMAIHIPASVALVPGTQSYAASQLALTCIALALGEELGTISSNKAKETLEYLDRIGECMKKTVEANYELIGKYVDEYYDSIHLYHLLGGGPNVATANFGTMKLLEAAGFDSIPQGIEEWAHSQYFTTRPGVHNVTIVPMGESRDRAFEVMHAVRVMDGKVIAIAEEGDTEVWQHADMVWPICGLNNIKEEFSHFVYAIPLEILAAHLGNKGGEGGILKFAQKPWVKTENFQQIYGSKIVSLAERNGSK